jgi:hypothetical protein
MQQSFLTRFLPALLVASFTLTGCGGGGGSNDDDNNDGVVVPPANSAPSVSTGGDREVDELTAVSITGSASDSDGTIASFQWTQLAGPVVVLSNAGTDTVGFTAPSVAVDTPITLRLTVTDDDSATASDDVVVTVRDIGGGGGDNLPPTANAGLDRDADELTTVSITGSASDSDGTIAGLQWTQEDGPAVTLSNATTATVSFTAPAVTAATPITLRLTATDDDGATGFDEVVVTVRDVPVNTNVAPSTDAGNDQFVVEDTAVALAGAAADSDGTIASLAWTQTAGPAVTLTGADTATPSFTAPAVDDETNLVFRLTATDDDGATDSDQVGVVVGNAAAPDVVGLAGACLDLGGPAELCGLFGTIETTLPDRIILASNQTPRGDLANTPAAPGTPSAKTVDGNPDDWQGLPTRIGGTVRLDRGEHIYTDYLFDAYGADDGTDAQRLEVLDPLAEFLQRTFRFDQLFQAAGDQFGAPPPIGALDHYGDATALDDEADLYELRWAADGDNVYLLARFSTLTDAANPGLLILLDTISGPAAAAQVGFDTGLSTQRFDRALLLTEDGAQTCDLPCTAATALDDAEVVVAPGADAAGLRWNNALEARLPATLFNAAGGTRVAVVAGPRTPAGITPANLAYRFDEPVAGVYNDKQQALALLAGNIDAFTTTISFRNLGRGASESFEIAPGYHERQFVSGENISRESSENGLMQRYGLYVPRNPVRNVANQMPLTMWMHYRGGKAHSGAAWTPRLITQLGEEQGNVVATPHGRGTSAWYVTESHQDFFEVFADLAGTDVSGTENLSVPAETPALLNIDPDRVYLSGYSMGGYATYVFGLLYPDLFAAGYPTSGAVTQGAWTGLGPDDFTCDLSGGEIPGVGEATSPCFVEANGSDPNAQLNYRILENARHFPIIIHHGSNDELALTPGAERMGLRLLELGYRYDMTTFLGYEHFTQAIVDEWADGAVYLNRFTRKANPREVTYKIVPALVNAVNTITADGVQFNFRPDGAYWMDGLRVRDADVQDPEQFGQIDAVSEAIAAPVTIPVPRTGEINPGAQPLPQVSTPVFSPGYHSTPYVRHGLEWQETGSNTPTANRFSATLRRLDRASFDLARMRIDPMQRADGRIASDGPVTLTFTGITLPLRVFVNGIERPETISADRVVVALTATDLSAGVAQIQFQPGDAALAFSPGELSGLVPFCRSLAPELQTVCDALESVETQLVNGCVTQFGQSPAFCGTLGGHLHGVIEVCRENGGSTLCKAADVMLEGIASGCRGIPEAPRDFCAVLGHERIAEQDIVAYEQSWTHRALGLQYELGAPLAFVDALFPATHNSFNSTNANDPQTLSGSDANQRYSSVDQLRMGIRALEVDVHWMPRADGSGFGPTVCHGNAFHFGCTLEKSLLQELTEIRSWLDANPDQVIVLYLENNMNEPLDGPTAQLVGTEQYAAAAQAITTAFGDLVYTPTDHADFLNAPFACNNGHPLEASIASMRATGNGKRLYIHTEGCDAGWANLVFDKEAGNRHTQGADKSQLATFSADGVCGGFDRATHKTRWTRYFEDGTLLGATTAMSDGSLTPVEAFRGMVRCGVNMPSMDHVTPSDPRLQAFVWSWEPGQPAVSQSLNCALHTAESRFRSVDCALLQRHACARYTPDGLSTRVEWVISPTAAAWNAPACPTDFAFAVPHNGYQNELLRLAKDAADVNEVWLNYTAQQGNWVAAP